MTAAALVVVVFVPAGDGERRHLDECARYADRAGLRVLTFTQDGATAAGLVARGEVDRVVVARPWHTVQLIPRVDVVSGPSGTVPGRSQRRTGRRVEWAPEGDPLQRRTQRRPQWHGPGPPLDPRTR